MPRIRIGISLVLMAAGAAALSRPAFCAPDGGHQQAQLLNNNTPRGLPGQPDIPILPPPPAPADVTPSFPAPSLRRPPRHEPSFIPPPPLLPQGMTITVNKVLSDKSGPDDARSSSPIGKPVQAVRELAKCWMPPLPGQGETVEVTIRFGFGANGSVLGTPRITYSKAPEGATSDQVRASILDAIKACTPLQFSKSMAASMPGYPLSVRYIGRRADEAKDRH